MQPQVTLTDLAGWARPATSVTRLAAARAAFGRLVRPPSAAAGVLPFAAKSSIDGLSGREGSLSMRCLIYLRVSTREQAEKGEGEEGSSIPAKREACARHIRVAGWQLVDEYADRADSVRFADRPALRAIPAQIGEDRDVDAVVVHKIDRLARNMEDDVAIPRAAAQTLRRAHSVTENVEETPSGRLVEGIHALMAEFYPANLASEIRKGMTQKAKQGGYPHAPWAT